ncbi:leucine-rich repeat protein, putative [Bodo saltans]|uniref:Leucine-rich repeat protein, putative n=1 Tax=Bodo saltans TaxID=75058 RepID=A0A0S4IPG0_BODSA|nr:leucine-rich repeat protein, putative [Bodo saltans]|eukprot:CUF05632.1 leucine-rich repeat protein, putative [Bodo saltans]
MSNHTPQKKRTESAQIQRTPAPPSVAFSSSGSRPGTAASASVYSRTAADGAASVIFRHKTRRNRTFLKDNDANAAVLPQPLPQGIPYVANYTTFDELLKRNILQQPIDEQVHLGTDDVRLIYDAKCVDQNLTPSWDREVRFMELLSSSCKGNFFTLTENGLGRTAAEAIAHILSVDSTYSILDLSGNRLRDEGAKCVAKLLTVNETLVHVGLRSNDIGFEGGQALADALCDNNTVTSLDLGAHSGINRNHLGSRGASALGTMLKANSVLCTLSISSNGLGAEGVAHLAAGMEENRALTHVDLSSNNLGYEGARVLASVIEATELQNLYLQRNGLTDRGGLQLATNMQRTIDNSSETIETLNLEWNDLGDGFAVAMARVIATTTRLKKLKLGGNDLTGGVKAIADALIENRSLVELSLSECHVAGSDGVALAAAIAANKTLKVLDLSKNRLGNDGVAPIAEALRKNKVLVSLNLSSNGIGDAGGVALTRFIKENSSLQELNLRHNSMTSTTGNLLDDELRNNSTLQRIDITYNDFTYKCFSGIQHTLSRNSASWSARAVPRLQGEIEVLDVKQKELVQVEEDSELEKRGIKDRGDQILRRKEEVRTLTETFRQEIHELEERYASAKGLAERAEEAYRFAEDRNSAEGTILTGKKNNLESKIQNERDKREKIIRDTDKLRKQLKAIQDAEVDLMKPFLQELAKMEAERNSDKADCKWQSEQLATLHLKRKQLETQNGTSTNGTTPMPGSPSKAAPRKK